MVLALLLVLRLRRRQQGGRGHIDAAAHARADRERSLPSIVLIQAATSWATGSSSGRTDASRPTCT